MKSAGVAGRLPTGSQRAPPVAVIVIAQGRADVRAFEKRCGYRALPGLEIR